MKRSILKMLMFFLSASLIAALSCTDNPDTETVGGKEYLLTGSWWVSSTGKGEGYYFDGAGTGYDLSLNESSQVYIVCDNAITYTFDGYNLSVVEHGITRQFTFEITGVTMANLTIMGYSFTATLQDLMAECIISNSINFTEH